MEYAEIKINIEEYLENESFKFEVNSSNMIVFDSCPKCGRNNKLYVNPENGLYKCHYARCDLHDGGNFVKFLHEVLDLSYKEAKKIVYDDDSSIFNSQKTLLDKIADKKIKEIKEKTVLPKMMIPLSKENNPKGWDYLLSRGLSEDEIIKLKIQTISNQNFFELRNEMRDQGFNDQEINYSCQFINRVIFPLWVNNEMKGFMARDYTGKDKIKTKNAIGNYRTLYFWNFDNVIESKEVVLCEGVFDAVKCGIDRSIAFLGTAFTEKQKDLLNQTNAEKIILCLDPGTDHIQSKIYKQLYIDYIDSIYTVKLPNYLYHKDFFLINEKFISQVEKLSNTKINEYGKNWIIIDPLAREYLKKNSKNNLIKISDPILRRNFINFFIESEYKDSGDYTKEEMEAFIQNAQKM